MVDNSSSLEMYPTQRNKWEIPNYTIHLWQGKNHPWCVIIPVINEGERIRSLLKKITALKIQQSADIIIVDSGSTDHSLDLEFLKNQDVCGLLTKTDSGKLSAQLRCGYAFALDLNYQGIITIDGNDKDDPSSIFAFIKALEDGVDFVQASRFIAGGIAKNTPKLREFAIRYIHAPLISFFSGFAWTDTTQGFRAYSRKLLLDPKMAPFRHIFSSYELLSYISYSAPKNGHRCIEIPTIRVYPAGEIPTKISFIKGHLLLLKILLKTCLGNYNPK